MSHSGGGEAAAATIRQLEQRGDSDGSGIH